LLGEKEQFNNQTSRLLDETPKTISFKEKESELDGS
jgi:hypothetical protein